MDDDDGFVCLDITDMMSDPAGPELVRITDTNDYVTDECVIHVAEPGIHDKDGAIQTLLNALSDACACTSDVPFGMKSMLQCLGVRLVLCMFGKRNITKKAVVPHKLSANEHRVYKKIRRELQNVKRRERVFQFLDQRGITKRLINYFVVHYCLLEHQVSYYLDRRTYPYQIVGELNTPNCKWILDLVGQGANIVWINLHQEYKQTKQERGHKNMHAPYARSTSVIGEDNREYSLCELNFYIWFDDIGGIDAFYRLESDIRKCKQRSDEQRRKVRARRKVDEMKQHKSKTVLKTTDGRNYATYCTVYSRPQSFVDFDSPISACKDVFAVSTTSTAANTVPDGSDSTVAPSQNSSKVLPRNRKRRLHDIMERVQAHVLVLP